MQVRIEKRPEIKLVVPVAVNREAESEVISRLGRNSKNFHQTSNNRDPIPAKNCT